MRFAALFLISCALMLPASAAPTAPAIPGLEAITPYQHGMQALSDRLPELAVTRFEEAFKIPNLTAEQNREILYRLTESQVRANQPEKALVTLNSKLFKDHPERDFWIAQSLAALGKYQEAIEHFKKLDPQSAYADDAILSLASLQLALGQRAESIKNYQLAAKSNNTITKIKASTTLAEIYLENGDLQHAKEAIARIPNSDKTHILKTALDAQLALRSKQYTAAIEKFSTFFIDAEKLSPRLYQIALLGLADARHAAGQQQEAALGLTEFVRTHQESPILLAAFERLSAWTPQPLTANTPFYQQLKKWAGRDPENALTIDIPLGSDSIINPHSPSITLDSTSPYLRGIAHFYYAKHTAQLDTPGALAQAQFEFSAFRLANPEHPLTGVSIFETAKIQLTLKQRLAALSTLQTLVKLAKDQEIQLSTDALAQASFISGAINVEQEDYAAALSAFELATQSTHTELANAAKINLGLAALRSSNLAAFDAQQKSISDSELSAQLSIERALWLAYQAEPEAREALQTFLLQHPQSTRAVDARIALASLCATVPPLDPLLSKALLDSIDQSTLDATQNTEWARTHYLLAELKQDWPTSIEIIDDYLLRYPESPQLGEFEMRKAIALYRNGEHNKARQLFGKIALGNPDSPLVTFCYYYAGMAARLEGTPQSLKESIDLFEKVIRLDAALSIEARIQQARVLLDINRTEEAKISLNLVYKPQSDSSQQREIGILLATALHTQGSEDPGQYLKAIAIYDQLLSHKQLPLAWSNQIHYMKGQTLESMGENTHALDSYYRVINKENLDPQAPEEEQEWKWFYQCGFKAIALLEKQQDYRAAVALARKIASYAGPESKTYSKRARALEMQHMIWEE